MADTHIGFLERLLSIIDKHGLFKIAQALFVLFAFLYIMYNVSNLDSIVENVFKTQTVERKEQHDAAVEVRRAIKPDIDLLLKSTLSEMNADRAFVIEMHNGTNNVAGLPFIYGEMTYEEVKGGISHIDEDYTSLNLSRFDFPMYIEREHMWIGTLEELTKIDGKLATRLASNDVSFMAIIQLVGVHNTLGYYGFTCCNKKTPSNIKEIANHLSSNAQKLSLLLDTTEVD